MLKPVQSHPSFPSPTRSKRKECVFRTTLALRIVIKNKGLSTLGFIFFCPTFITGVTRIPKIVSYVVCVIFLFAKRFSRRSKKIRLSTHAPQRPWEAFGFLVWFFFSFPSFEWYFLFQYDILFGVPGKSVFFFYCVFPFCM